MTTADEIEKDRTERWFVRQGLPHLIDHYSVREDVLTRMVPFLGLVVFLELFLVFGDRWSGVSQLFAFVGGLVAMVGAFVAVNRLRGRPPWMMPDTAGAPELVLFFVLTSIPTAIGAEGARSENLLFGFGINLALVAVGFVLTAWGIIPMLRWSLGQMWSQIHDIANLTMKSLPILLIFSAFIFLNAEMWQVANDFTMPYFFCVLAVVLLVGDGSRSTSPGSNGGRRSVRSAPGPPSPRWCRSTTTRTPIRRRSAVGPSGTSPSSSSCRRRSRSCSSRW